MMLSKQISIPPLTRLEQSNNLILVSRDRIYQYQVIFYSNRGVDLELMMKIPPPVLKENEAEYLEELSKIKKAEDWVEKYSGESLSYQTGDDTEQNHVVISTQISTSSSISDVSLMQFVILFLFLLALPFALLLLLGLFLESLFNSWEGGCYGVCGLSGWGGP